MLKKVLLGLISALFLASLVLTGCQKSQSEKVLLPVAQNSTQSPAPANQPAATQTLRKPAQTNSDVIEISATNLIAKADKWNKRNVYYKEDPGDFETYVGKYARITGGTFYKMRGLDLGYSSVENSPWHYYVAGIPFVYGQHPLRGNEIELIGFDDQKFALGEGDLVVVEGVVREGSPPFSTARLDFKKMVRSLPAAQQTMAFARGPDGVIEITLAELAELRREAELEKKKTPGLFPAKARQFRELFEKQTTLRISGKLHFFKSWRDAASLYGGYAGDWVITLIASIPEELPDAKTGDKITVQGFFKITNLDKGVFVVTKVVSVEPK